MKKVLVACEESQAVTIELRKLGIEAYSCDLEPCSGGHPEWHLQKNVMLLLEQEWDMIIAFPPCTYLTVTGNRWFNIERYGDKAIQRHKDRDWAIMFFMSLANAKTEKAMKYRKYFIDVEKHFILRIAFIVGNTCAFKNVLPTTPLTVSVILSLVLREI